MRISQLFRTFLTVALLIVASTLACAEPADHRAKSDPPPANITVTGRLTDDGVECQALRTDDKTLYTLVGDLSGFKTNDRVTVEGARVEVSTCMQGVTIRIASIKKAD